MNRRLCLPQDRLTHRGGWRHIAVGRVAQCSQEMFVALVIRHDSSSIEVNRDAGKYAPMQTRSLFIA